MPEVDIDADEAVARRQARPRRQRASTTTSGSSRTTAAMTTKRRRRRCQRCRALGIAAEVSGVDSRRVSGDTVCTPVPADVPAACVTAAASPDNPAGLVVCAEP